MRISNFLSVVTLLLFASVGSAGAEPIPTSFFDLSATTLAGEKTSFRQYQGNVLLVVNTASKCGFTPQFAGLEDLYEKYGKEGFLVLGFPSNDFGEQEPGTNAQIQQFSSSEYKVKFPLFDKAPVSGLQKQPVYKFLTEQSGPAFQGEIGWNFVKFLVDRKGNVRYRFSSLTTPSSQSLINALEDLLKEKS